MQCQGYSTEHTLLEESFGPKYRDNQSVEIRRGEPRAFTWGLVAPAVNNGHK